MIYSVIGTNKEIREKAYREFASLGTLSASLYSESSSEIERYLDGVSLFGDTTVVACVQLGDVASSKDTLLTLLPRMEHSSTIFIVDEPFADVKVSNALTKFSKKCINAKEEKKKETGVFALCHAFAKKDKKEAWVLFIQLRNKGEEAEAIQGALWWKFKDIWQGVRDGKKSAFTLLECERVGGDLVRSSIRAHRGELDLMVELERIILSL